MKILGTGLDFAGNPLFKPMDEGAFITALKDTLEQNAQSVRGLTRSTTAAFTFRDSIERAVQDPGNPRVAGWTFLLNSADPQREQLETILAPLARHRGMTEEPLLYHGEPPDEWHEWLQENYHSLSLEGKKPPHYILIVGGPNLVPFQFQSLLSIVANVGRIDFESLDDLRQYIEKLIRVETADEPCVTPEAVLFAPDAGLPDPTYFSREYMAKPLIEHIRDQLGFAVHAFLGPEATKTNLLKTLRTKKPALVYIASHGLGAISESLDIQKRYNGAICCQHQGQLTQDHLFLADDVPFDQPFLEGAVFFQFACFGYGTPAESDFAHWVDGIPKKYADSDFVAALPRRLLAHPRGPIAFIGHIDMAFLHGFVEPEVPFIFDRWHSRIAPFKVAVDQFLAVEPSGLAMREMTLRFNTENQRITSVYDRISRNKWQWNADRNVRFLDSWITRSDAQNYMIFGDPAAHLRI